MSKILIDRAPKLLQLDNGKEFYNTNFDNLMAKYNIHKYSTFSIIKACIVERFNRTLKEKMFREFTARGSHEWISILPKLLNEYNNSKHRTIGMTPVQADLNPTSVTIKQREINNEKIKFKVGHNVRISAQKGVFTKDYMPNWSTEIFEIIKINKTLPVTYQLQDYTGKPIAGCFYSAEIHKTEHPNEYLIEKIIRKKQNKMLVKWLGFDNTHNSWINTLIKKKKTLIMLKYSVSRIIAMNVFGGSQAGDTKKIISDIQSSNKTLQNEINNQQKEIHIIKSNVVHLLTLENRMSELFNNYIETNTTLSFILSSIDSVNTEIKRITVMNVFGSSQAGETKKTISKFDDSIKIIRFELNEKMSQLENNTKIIEQKLSNIEQLTENLKFKVSDLEDNVDYMKSQISDLVGNDAENIAEIKKPKE
ncbi:uncharacterized protein LOC126553624 [Aphis gossypii]|uniref:uncharacterized protein LOC126553624 n=1 Tax=Aphis gossypii TaxID=80765 RepID=UPI002158BEA0|nr:uncharacterized protein LOC126553624 [Aphis gossypii]